MVSAHNRNSQVTWNLWASFCTLSCWTKMELSRNTYTVCMHMPCARSIATLYLLRAWVLEPDCLGSDRSSAPYLGARAAASVSFSVQCGHSTYSQGCWGKPNNPCEVFVPRQWSLLAIFPNEYNFTSVAYRRWVFSLKNGLIFRKPGAVVDQMAPEMWTELHTLFTCSFFCLFFSVSMNCLRDPVSPPRSPTLSAPPPPYWDLYLSPVSYFTL